MPTSEEMELYKQTLYKDSEDHIFKSLEAPDSIYLDLRLLKDYNVGLMLSYVTEPNTQFKHPDRVYEYILSCLNDYAKREYDDAYHYFQDMWTHRPVEQIRKELEDRLHDPRLATFIFLTCPDTRFLGYLLGRLTINVNHSAVANKRSDITLHINTYPLLLQKEIAVQYAAELSNSLKVSVQIFCKDPIKITADELKTYDVIYTYYLDRLFENRTVQKAIFEDFIFTEKKFVFPKFLGTTYRSAPKDLQVYDENNKLVARIDPKQEFAFTHSRLNCVIEFDYIDVDVVSALLPEYTPQERKIDTSVVEEYSDKEVLEKFAVLEEAIASLAKRC